MLQLFGGYNAHSPTLKSSLTAGDCLGPKWRNKVAWLDPAAPIHSGDYVQLEIRYADGVVARPIKRLEVTRDGRWWGICNDGVFLIGNLVVPSAVVRVVALGDAPAGYEAPPVVKRASEEELGLFAELAAPALREWEQQGYPPRQPWPGLATVIARARGEA